MDNNVMDSNIVWARNAWKHVSVMWAIKKHIRIGYWSHVRCWTSTVLPHNTSLAYHYPAGELGQEIQTAGDWSNPTAVYDYADIATFLRRGQWQWKS